VNKLGQSPGGGGTTRMVVDKADNQGKRLSTDHMATVKKRSAKTAQI